MAKKDKPIKEKKAPTFGHTHEKKVKKMKKMKKVKKNDPHNNAVQVFPQPEIGFIKSGK